jgi:hypothetical protein
MIELDVGRVLVVKLMIQPENVAPVKTGQHPLLARQFRAGVFIARKDAEREPVFNLQLQIREPRLFTLAKSGTHFAKRISIQPIDIGQQLALANRIARLKADPL